MAASYRGQADGIHDGIWCPSLNGWRENTTKLRPHTAIRRRPIHSKTSTPPTRTGQIKTLIVYTEHKEISAAAHQGQRHFNHACTTFPKDVECNNGPLALGSDFVEGLEVLEYQDFPVDGQVSGAALFRDNSHFVTWPHITGGWEGQSKVINKAKMQSRPSPCLGRTELVI